MVWVSYRKKYGPMNDVRRFDRPAALLSSILIKLRGGKATQQEFMPFGKEEKEEAALEDVIAVFGGVNRVGKSR